MQNAATVLEVIRERGKKGMPLERLYRQLFNSQLFLMAYGRIYANKGAMTPGVTGETVDGMSLAKIETIIQALRSETYRWTPVKRIKIPKKNRGSRPLGLPIWSDKLVAEVVRLLLDAYYDPQFSDRSHGFRPRRGCHTALTEVANTWTGTRWFIEGDISDCFGSLDHEIVLAILGEKIHDGRFLRLIDRMLKAGYLEDWRWNATLSGAPQGGIVSPLLSNIYLDRLDRFVEQELMPDYNRGDKREHNPEYMAICAAILRAKRRKDVSAVRELRRQRRRLPSNDPNDPGYRRLKYVRYADDWLLGFAGPKREAEEIKDRVRDFLRADLGLELSVPKTLITHAATQAARFLGYDVKVQHEDTKLTGGRRTVNGGIGLYVPRDVIRQRCMLYMCGGKPTHRSILIHDSDYTIMMKYQTEYRGFVQYYFLAQDVWRLHTLHWVMGASLLKTMAAKYNSTVAKMARRFNAMVETPLGPRRCFQVMVPRDGKKPLIARFGGIPLQRQRGAVISDRKPVIQHTWANELIRRLLAGQCEICESRMGLQVHHIRKMADLNKPGRPETSEWTRRMAQRRRKTLVVCEACHHAIHAGRLTTSLRNQSLESGMLRK
ncbi:reverse transcriptase domain-containing protein [Streptomyces sp. NPDC058464]|uniref:reverse transcriptase/maturase family protein n=1 Tax=Streptomyces sp. NPDC058464 TaxID=3346511 RepID=UPI00365034A0